MCVYIDVITDFCSNNMIIIGFVWHIGNIGDIA